jgi:hypothetical protein
MTAISRTVRLVGSVTLAFGIILAIAAYWSDERVNQSGYVPGVIAGYVAIAMGGMAFILASRISKRQLGLGILVVALMGWFSASTWIVVWDDPAGILDAMPLNRPDAALVVGAIGLGFICSLMATMTVIFVGILLALAWLADLLPPLRRRGLGDALRRQVRGNRW